jgi:hypothetical protein
MMEMPKPGAEHARLARLVGNWRGEEQLSPSPWGAGGVAIGRFQFRFGVDGMALLQDYEEEKEGQVVFRAHGVFLIDPVSGDVLWWWFDSFGFPPDPPARGRWVGDALRFEKHTPRGSSRYTMDFGNDGFAFRIENRLAGQDNFTEFMRGLYWRAG